MIQLWLDFLFTDRKWYSSLYSRKALPLVSADDNISVLILAAKALKISHHFLIINKCICTNQTGDELDGNCKPCACCTSHLTRVPCLKASQAFECESKDRLCSYCCFDHSFLDMLFPLSYSEITFGNLFDSEAHKWVNVYIFGLTELGEFHGR